MQHRDISLQSIIFQASSPSGKYKSFSPDFVNSGEFANSDIGSAQLIAND